MSVEKGKPCMRGGGAESLETEAGVIYHGTQGRGWREHDKTWILLVETALSNTAKLGGRGEHVESVKQC